MSKITREDALEYHRLGGKPGKISITPTKPIAANANDTAAKAPSR